MDRRAEDPLTFASAPSTIRHLPLTRVTGPPFRFGTKNDGDILVALDVLARDVGILGIFSDWAGTYYANCMGL